MPERIEIEAEMSVRCEHCKEELVVKEIGKSVLGISILYVDLCEHCLGVHNEEWYRQGINDGNDKGYEQGYNRGHEDGLEDAKKTMKETSDKIEKREQQTRRLDVED
jgi:predicted transposase YdaD